MDGESNKCGMTRENMTEKENSFPLKECAGCSDFSEECGTYVCSQISRLFDK